jgi:hypothetical protein
MQKPQRRAAERYGLPRAALRNIECPAHADDSYHRLDEAGSPWRKILEHITLAERRSLSRRIRSWS